MSRVDNSHHHLLPAAFRCLSAMVFLMLICRPTIAWQLTQEPTTSSRYQRYIDDFMTRFDTNEDGFIDEVEKQNANRRVLENADADKNGLISPEEILDNVAGNVTDLQDPETALTKTTAEDADKPVRYDPKVIRVSATILKLPPEFAQSQALSLDDIFKKISGLEPEKELEEGVNEQGLQVLDRFEVEAIEGMTSEIKIAGESVSVISRSLTSQGKVVHTRGLEFSSFFKLLPTVVNGHLKLNVDYDARYVLPGDSGRTQSPQTIELALKSDFLFVKKNTSAVNLFSAGHHFLMILSADLSETD